MGSFNFAFVLVDSKNALIGQGLTLITRQLTRLLAEQPLVEVLKQCLYQERSYIITRHPTRLLAKLPLVEVLK